jgi:hypothetical protein
MTELTNMDDFVFNITEDGKIKSSGYLVNSFLLKNKLFPQQKGGENENNKLDTSIFENLAIPAGLFYTHYSCPNKNYFPIIGNDDVTNDVTKNTTLNDDIYEKLFQMVLSDKQKKKIQTKRNKIKILTHKKTKKNKKE